MDLTNKLEILTEGAKYDVACTSSGVNRAGKQGTIGSAAACGICHSFTPDGRCISLLKLLMTNVCIYDCKYCINRKSNDVPRASFTPKEIADITIDFYRRNYIEGLFLSSGITKNADHTMELLIETLRLLRKEYHFNGYIHVKAIPGADAGLVRMLGHLTDRMSVNIELPTEKSLLDIAPDKNKQAIIAPMKYVKNTIIEAKESKTPFVPAGQSTQMIIGATPENDNTIMNLTQNLYDKFNLKRVFYSAYIPVGKANNKQELLPTSDPPLLREHRLYQADWLLRFYNFTAQELFTKQENLSLHLDPKCRWALENPEFFPIEINKADYNVLLRVPGIGQISAKRIVSARRVGKLDFTNLKKIGVVLKRAKYFITCGGKMQERFIYYNSTLAFSTLEHRLADNRHAQLTLF